MCLLCVCLSLCESAQVCASLCACGARGTQNIDSTAAHLRKRTGVRTSVCRTDTWACSGALFVDCSVSAALACLLASTRCAISESSRSSTCASSMPPSVRALPGAEFWRAVAPFPSACPQNCPAAIKRCARLKRPPPSEVGRWRPYYSIGSSLVLTPCMVFAYLHICVHVCVCVCVCVCVVWRVNSVRCLCSCAVQIQTYMHTYMHSYIHTTSTHT